MVVGRSTRSRERTEKGQFVPLRKGRRTKAKTKSGRARKGHGPSAYFAHKIEIRCHVPDWKRWRNCLIMYRVLNGHDGTRPSTELFREMIRDYYEKMQYRLLRKGIDWRALRDAPRSANPSAHAIEWEPLDEDEMVDLPALPPKRVMVEEHRPGSD